MISIVIPTLNRADLLGRCIAALSRTALEAEIVIVGEGLSFAEHCNLGAQRAKGDILIFLNDDTEPQPGWLEPLVASFEDPEVGIAGSRLVYPDGRIQHAGVYFDRPGGVLTAHNVTTDEPTRDVAAVTGACLAVRQELFDGFDEGFVNGYEDVDLCLRVTQAGWRIRYVTESVVVHHESQSGPARWTHVRHNIERLQEKWAEVST